jgi:hypothetical protein
MIAVIGHAPSLQGSGLGEYIDSFKYVVRFPYLGDWQVPEHYGVRTSYFCASGGRLKQRIREDPPEIGYFIWNKYLKCRVPIKVWGRLNIKCEDVKCEEVSPLIHKWARKLPASSCQYLSTGTCGILIAADKIGEPITVFGCDDLKIGRDMGKGYIGSWLYENRPGTGALIAREGAHSLSAERKLIDVIAKEYNVTIEFK